MNKKRFLWWLLIIWLLSGILSDFWHGQDYTEADMNAITMSFCDKGLDKLETLWTVVTVEPGKEQNICLYVQNAWDKKMEFEYGFTEWGSTPEWTHMCISAADNSNRFSMLIPYTKKRIVTIDPMSNKIIEENIIIPPGLSGLQLGCLVYKLVKPEWGNEGWMFQIVVQRSRKFDIYVWGETSVKSSVRLIATTGGTYSTNKNFKAVVDKDNNMNVNMVLQNNGNVWQNIEISGKIYNMLWFQKDFSEKKILMPWNTTEINLNAGILPIYKWLFDVKIDIKHTPMFVFEIKNEKLKEPGFVSETWKIFVFSRTLVIIGAIIVIYILYKIFWHKKQIVISPTS